MPKNQATGSCDASDGRPRGRRELAAAKRQMTTKRTDTPAADPRTAVDRDVVVVGGGAAGLSAAVFLARFGFETAVFARGASAIEQCAHLENYLGFPGGVSPERFLALGRDHAETEGATVREELVERVEPVDDGTTHERFRVETAGGSEVTTTRVVAATAYDGDPFEPLDVESTDPDPFVGTDDGRTPTAGFYACGWMTAETAHQAIINAGHGARTALSVIRDDLRDRYWDAVADRYVDWVVDEDRYGGDGWAEGVDEWFDREMLPAEGVDEATVADARADLKAEFLGRRLDEAERQRRDRRGQRCLLERLDDDVVREYATELDG